jgi:tRNA dimethylallyltransferase
MTAETGAYNCIVILGPTASGKTALAVRIADALGGEIISADCRQVYRGLDIGSGKDLCEYCLGDRAVPHHLIDIADLSREYSVFDFQRDADAAFEDISARGKLPVAAGGTGMYLDSFIRGYDFAEAPENAALRASLADKSMEELTGILRALKDGRLHNTTDTRERGQLIRAIEIASALRDKNRVKRPRPRITPLVLGIFIPRDRLRQRIAARLKQRLDAGMIDETARLHAAGASWERLERLGLEYRFTAQFLQGKLPGRDALFTALNTEIGRFAKRQETWFRGMERKGVVIHRVPPFPEDARAEAAMALIRETGAAFWQKQ